MRWLCLLAVLAGPVQAGIVGEGQSPLAAPQPEALGLIDGLYTGARLVLAGTEDLAGTVEPGQDVALEVGIMAGEDTAPGDVNLTCEVRFVEPDGSIGKPQFKGRCLTTTREALRSRWTLLPIGMTFRPRVEDPAGVAAVQVVLRDDQGNKVTLVPSYDWTGGRK